MRLQASAPSLETGGARGPPASCVIDPQGRIVLRAGGRREFDDPETVAQSRELLGK
jgi:hypothetical protein